MMFSRHRGRAALPSMNIVDLRQTTVRQLEPLLEEEASHWRDELHWDYRGALDLIKRFLEARALCGSVAFENGSAAGYSFYVLEEQKGLIGGLYVSTRYPQAAIGRRLLEEMLFSMRAVPQLSRIEAQLMPFGGPVDAPLLEQGFHLYTRQFMLLDLRRSADSRPGAAAGMRLDRWNDRYFEPCAKLIYLCYADHVDGEINDQYRSRSGALKFLKNIILLPGCGQFVPTASYVLRQPGSDDLIAAVLTSEVSPAVGHTTQICVLPGYQGHGIGRNEVSRTYSDGHDGESLRRTTLRKPGVHHHPHLHGWCLAALRTVLGRPSLIGSGDPTPVHATLRFVIEE
jgi:ribosomal protein S18 acetylase RimI-like enzyme